MEVKYLRGIFGEMEGCNGLGISMDINGKTYLKIAGCSYFFEGDPGVNVYFFEQAKSNFLTLPRYIFKNSYLFSLAIIFRLLFQKKKAIRDVHWFVEEVNHKTIRHFALPDNKLNDFTQEIRRAMRVSLDKVFSLSRGGWAVPEKINVRNFKEWEINLAAAVAKLTVFFTAAVNQDTAYSFVTQDALENLNKENAKQSAKKELVRILELVNSRENDKYNVAKKWEFLRKAVYVLFFFLPILENIVKEFFLELNVEKVKLTESHWYFCLRRTRYDYRGVPIEKRLEELERIDKEKGHFYGDFRIENGKPVFGEKINAWISREYKEFLHRQGAV